MSGSETWSLLLDIRRIAHWDILAREEASVRLGDRSLAFGDLVHDVGQGWWVHWSLQVLLEVQEVLRPSHGGIVRIIDHWLIRTHLLLLGHCHEIRTSPKWVLICHVSLQLSIKILVVEDRTSLGWESAWTLIWHTLRNLTHIQWHNLLWSAWSILMLFRKELSRKNGLILGLICLRNVWTWIGSLVLYVDIR